MARFTASIDDELKEKLDKFASVNGFNRSEALELILRERFEGKAQEPEPDFVEPAPPEPQPPQIQQPDLSALEERLEKLELENQQVKDYLTAQNPTINLAHSWILGLCEYLHGASPEIPLIEPPPWLPLHTKRRRRRRKSLKLNHMSLEDL